MRVGVGLALVVCLAMPAAVAQSPDFYVESKIRALEGLRLQAYRGRDLRTLNKILDDRFVGVGVDGEERSKTKELTRIMDISSLQYLLFEVNVRMHGDTAIATGLYEMQGVLRKKAFVEHGRFVDTWLNKEGEWVMIGGLSTPAQ